MKRRNFVASVVGGISAFFGLRQVAKASRKQSQTVRKSVPPISHEFIGTVIETRWRGDLIGGALRRVGMRQPLPQPRPVTILQVECLDVLVLVEGYKCPDRRIWATTPCFKVGDREVGCWHFDWAGKTVSMTKRSEPFGYWGPPVSYDVVAYDDGYKQIAVV